MSLRFPIVLVLNYITRRAMCSLNHSKNGRAVVVVVVVAALMMMLMTTGLLKPSSH